MRTEEMISQLNQETFLISKTELRQLIKCAQEEGRKEYNDMSKKLQEIADYEFPDSIKCWDCGLTGELTYRLYSYEEMEKRNLDIISSPSDAVDRRLKKVYEEKRNNE